MSNGRFRRVGERREWQFANDHCLGATCLVPIVVIETSGKPSPSEFCTCRTRLKSGCPDNPVYDDKQEARLEKVYVKP